MVMWILLFLVDIVHDHLTAVLGANQFMSPDPHLMSTNVHLMSTLSEGDTFTTLLYESQQNTAGGMARSSGSRTSKHMYRCNFCGKMCKHKNDMKKHVRVHTGERPYKCEKCGISFTQKQLITRHNCGLVAFSVPRRKNRVTPSSGNPNDL